MTRPDPSVRQLIQLYPPADIPRYPTQWQIIAAFIWFAIALAAAWQI